MSDAQIKQLVVARPLARMVQEIRGNIANEACGS